MSADNYEVVRKTPDGRYFVTTEFASDDRWPSTAVLLDARTERYTFYDTFEEAVRVADSEHSEYGVTIWGDEEEQTALAIESGAVCPGCLRPFPGVVEA